MQSYKIHHATKAKHCKGSIVAIKNGKQTVVDVDMLEPNTKLYLCPILSKWSQTKCKCLDAYWNNKKS